MTRIRAASRASGAYKKLPLRLLAGLLILHASWVPPLHAQQAPAPRAQTESPEGFNTQQLDALLAPVALYPDELLTQLLMASTFPLQVVQAGRWADDPAHKSLTGDALTKALETETWDPSVKSLVPFPQVLSMMNQNLEWMQQLGYAFAGQQAEVFDSVQRLRQQAMSTGHLESSEHQVVRTEQVAYTAPVAVEGQPQAVPETVATERSAIVIEPAQPDVVYVPSYNPATVYGTWPYPTYPPVYLPPPPGYAFGTALATGLAFGAGVAITAGLWNWARPAWGGGYANVNVNRYNNINVNRSQVNSSRWQANRAATRPAGLTRPPAGPVGAPARANGLPSGAVGRSSVSVPANAVRPPARSSGTARSPAGNSIGQGAAGRAANRPGQAGGPSGAGSRLNQSAASRPNRPAERPAASRPQQRSTAFGGVSQGRQAGQFSQRGAQSRGSAQMQRPAGGRGGSGGGRGGGGRGGGRR
jgi:hypothetical protein